MVVTVLVIAVGFGCVLTAGFKIRRDQEWAHGGDALAVRAELRLADARTLPAATVALGYPASEPVNLPGAFTQSVVARISWRGSAPRNGDYQLIVLDKRLTPPRPLRVYGGWSAAGGTGSNWASAYEKLAAHYDWLAGTASVHNVDGSWTSAGQAVGTHATGLGTLTAVFLVPSDALAFTDTAQLLVALFYVDATGEVRWARHLAG